MMTRPLRLLAYGIVISVGLLLCACGQSEKEPEQPRKVVGIGSILPLSGEMAKYGKTSLAALELAIDEANRRQGVYTFKLIPEDDRLTASVGVAAARKLLDVDKVQFIVGAWPSSVTGAVIPVSDAAGAVLISPASSTPNLSSSKGLFFRTCASDLDEGRAAAEYALNTLHARHLAVVYIRNDFGQGLLRVFSDRATKRGAEVVLADGFELGASDFRVLLAKIAATSPDAIYVVGYREMIPLFRQAQEMKIKAPWIGTTMLNDPSMVRDLKGAGDGVVFPSLDFSNDLADADFQAFRKQIKARTEGLDVDVFAANAFDAARLLTKTIETVGPDPTAVAKSLHGNQTFRGIWGDFTFDPAGTANREIVYKKIVSGQIMPKTVNQR